MIDAAERDGLLERGRSVIVEPTSGNTGIALALVAAARDYRLILTLPEGMSRERTALLRTYGAEVHETPSLGGMNEAVELANRLAEEHDGFIPQQFSNPANPRSTAGRPPRRSGATSTGRSTRSSPASAPAARSPAWARCSRSAVRTCRIVGVEPAASPVLSGGQPGPHKIQGIGAGFVPDVLDRDVIDEVVGVTDEDALDTARASAQRRGPADRDLRRRRGAGGARPRRARGDGGQADRGDRARLR